MDKRLQLKLNAGRVVTGVLRGFDPYMNIVLDDSVEEKKDKKNKIGMVVSAYSYFALEGQTTHCRQDVNVNTFQKRGCPVSYKLV
jgi:small nuclear ribonucleoprotein (snRNP)-like protein